MHMEADDAADLVGELPEERREQILELLPDVQRRRVRALLGHDPATAGGLMSPEFVCVYSQATLPEVFERIRGSRCSAESHRLDLRDEHAASVSPARSRSPTSSAPRKGRGSARSRASRSASAPTPISRRSRV